MIDYAVKNIYSEQNKMQIANNIHKIYTWTICVQVFYYSLRVLNVPRTSLYSIRYV